MSISETGVNLTKHQFDTPVVFAYNVGIGEFKGSILLAKLNKGDIAGAVAEFPRWVRGGGKVLPGLVARRKAEQALFLTGKWR